MTFAERLRAGPPLVVTFSMIATPQIPELLAAAGFDGVVLDCEHGPLGPESLNWLVPACRAAGLTRIVRVRAPEASLIGGALDVGAAGVLVPQVESAAVARAAVAAARFGAGGSRGTNPYVRAATYQGNADYFARANGAGARAADNRGGGRPSPRCRRSSRRRASMPCSSGRSTCRRRSACPGRSSIPTCCVQVERLVRDGSARGESPRRCSHRRRCSPGAGSTSACAWSASAPTRRWRSTASARCAAPCAAGRRRGPSSTASRAAWPPPPAGRASTSRSGANRSPTWRIAPAGCRW